MRPDGPAPFPAFYHFSLSVHAVCGNRLYKEIFVGGCSRQTSHFNKWSTTLTLPSIPSTRMSTNEPPSALIKVDPPSPSSSPSRIRVYGYGYDDRDSTEPTNGSSSPRATSAPVLPQLPQPPLQVHIHCYPSTQCNLQNASGGNFPIPRHTVDNPSPSASLNVVCTLTNIVFLSRIF